MLEFYSDKKDSKKVSKIIHEMKKYKDIKLGALKYGNDNRRYTADADSNTIYSSLKGVKYINDEVKEYLWFIYENYKVNNFIELYKYLTYKLNKRHIETLIKIGYFSDFGNQLKLIKWISYSNEVFSKKQYRKEQLTDNMYAFVYKHSFKETDKTLYVDEDGTIALQEELFSILPNEEYSFVERVKHEVELVGELISEIPEGVTVGGVGAVSYKKPVFLFKSWKNGKEVWVNLDNKKLMPKRDYIVLLYNIESRLVGGRSNIFADIEVIKED